MTSPSFENRKWLDFDSSDCPVAGAMGILGDKWTLLIIRDAFNGLKRFDDFQKSLGAPRALLAKRLKTLEDKGVMEKTPYRQPGERERFEYRLTAKGIDLQNVVLALKEWGDKHINPPEVRPTIIVDKDSGERVKLQVVRESDGQPVPPHKLRTTPGPSAKLKG